MNRPTSRLLHRYLGYAAWFAMLGAGAALAQPFEHSAAASDADLARRIHVSGLRIAATGAVAIINDRLVTTGEYIDGIEVLAIESDRVHLHGYDRTFAMRVGSPLIRESHLSSPEPQTRWAAAAAQQRRELRTSPERYGPVAAGETLSEIAERLLPDGVARTALMNALYEANAASFGGSIDVLFAGVTLRVPDVVPNATPETPPIADSPFVAAAPDTLRPGPLAGRLRVTRGDTLSEIALRVARVAEVTLNDAMRAIYADNPHAFGGDMHLLFAGSELELPDPARLHAQVAATSPTTMPCATVRCATGQPDNAS